MKQICLGSGFELVAKCMRVFFDEMDKVIPWSNLLALIAPHAPECKMGRPLLPQR